MKNSLLVLFVVAFSLPEIFAGCTYSLDNQKVVVGWTGYKTKARAGVGGKFTHWEAKNSSGSSILEVMKKGTFSIDTTKLSTKNPDRDKKIIKFFFGKMLEQGIKGSTQNLKGDDKKGSFDLVLVLNKVKKYIHMTYTISDDQVVAQGKINVLDFKMQKSMAGINSKEGCLLKHGKGGSWPDVDLKLVAPFKKKC